MSVVPNSMLLRWIEEEELRKQQLERRCLALHEMRHRDGLELRETLQRTEFDLLLRSFLQMSVSVSAYQLELDAAERSWLQRSDIPTVTSAARSKEVQLVAAHTELTEMDAAHAQSMEILHAKIKEEQGRWDVERRWMERQLASLRNTNAVGADRPLAAGSHTPMITTANAVAAARRAFV